MKKITDKELMEVEELSKSIDKMYPRAKYYQKRVEFLEKTPRTEINDIKFAKAWNKFNNKISVDYNRLKNRYLGLLKSYAREILEEYFIQQYLVINKFMYEDAEGYLHYKNGILKYRFIEKNYRFKLNFINNTLTVNGKYIPKHKIMSTPKIIKVSPNKEL